MRNQEKPKNNVSSKQYFEAGAGGGGHGWGWQGGGEKKVSEWGRMGKEMIWRAIFWLYVISFVLRENGDSLWPPSQIQTKQAL